MAQVSRYRENDQNRSKKRSIRDKYYTHFSTLHLDNVCVSECTAQNEKDSSSVGIALFDNEAANVSSNTGKKEIAF